MTRLFAGAAGLLPKFNTVPDYMCAVHLPPARSSLLTLPAPGRCHCCSVTVAGNTAPAVSIRPDAKSYEVRMQWNNKTLDYVALRAGFSRIGCESIRKGSSPVPYVKHSVHGANAVDEDPACLSALVNDVSR